MPSLPDRPRVAFLGLGLMGSNMARRVLAAGFPLAIYNRTAEKAAPLAAEGARLCASPREAAGRADVVVGMVADDTASRSLWLGENGALAGAGHGAVVVESSTITVGWARELHSAALARGCAFLDAPVTGSKPQAAAGELRFLVGGDAAALATARPVLEAMGRTIVHLGPAGSGVLMKLINNFMTGVQAASLAEAFGMIERSGLDGGQAMSVLVEGAPGSPMVKTLAARMAARDVPPNFTVKLMAKDLDYARAEATAQGLSLQTAAAALQIFITAVARGDGDRDISAVVDQFRSP